MIKSAIAKISIFGAGFILGGLFGASSALDRFSSGSAPLKQAALETLAAALLVSENYVESKDPGEIKKMILQGFVSKLDAHSAFLDSKALSAMQQDMNGLYGGIGVSSSYAPGKGVKIEQIAPQGPADKAGLRPGDLIVAADGKSLADMPMQDIMALLRGKPGSALSVSVVRGEKNISAQTLREEIKPRSVQYAILPAPQAHGKTLLLKIRSFTDATAREMSEIVQEAAASSKISAVVLDLRSNPGGLVSAAVAAAAFFLPEGIPVVESRGSKPQLNAVLKTIPDDYISGSSEDWPAITKEKLPSLLSVPMAVLVDSQSASASEILSGALQDHKRASVVGQRTFGKGSIQQVFALGSERASSDAIKITVARYHTPAGRSIQALGIEPDVKIKSSRPELREEDMPNALLPDSAAAGQARSIASDAYCQRAADKSPRPQDSKAGNIFVKRLPDPSPASDEELRAALDELKKKR